MQDIFNPQRPAGAYDDLLARVLTESRERRSWEPSDGPLPALFVSHGAPPTLDDPQWMEDLYAWGSSLPKPRGIVVISAHWENAPLAISATNAAAPLYYDFGGFHPRYYSLKYGTPDATELARQVVGMLADGTPMHHYQDRGLDHGAFIPLMAMFPAADVPVIQLSMPSLNPQDLFELGQRLRKLRAEGILVIGSGFMTHSFEVLRNPNVIPRMVEFDVWAADAIARGDVDALMDYRHRGPHARRAHPTADHFVPLLLTLGAADDLTRVGTARDEISWGNSTRSIQVA